ncbi:FAD-binding oxidoreductase [Ensifer sp. MPMI2T]|nr:FAD-binding oxidoreductase [Ensifer sp. MPMI2T]
MSDAFLTQLSFLLDPSSVLTGPSDRAGYQGDFALPRGRKFIAVARPKTTEDVSNVVKLCHSHGVVITPRGGGTGLAGGATPIDGRPGIVLSFERLNRVRSVDSVGATMIVEAGVTLHAAQAVAREAGFLLGIEHGGAGSSQIGGNFATNAGGNNVLRYGMARDQALGLEGVLADGTLVDLLQPLRKNNAGYDLKHLLIGSEGTLGLITAISLKLRPLPVRRATAFVSVATLNQVLLMLELLQRSLGECLSAFELIAKSGLDVHFAHAKGGFSPIGSEAPWYLLIEADTAASQYDVEASLSALLGKAIEENLITDGTIAQSEQHRSEFWRIREGVADATIATAAAVKSDTAVAINAIPEFIERATKAVLAIAPECRPVPFGHVGDGNIHFNVFPPTAAHLESFLAVRSQVAAVIEDIAIEMGGTISAEHGIGVLKRDSLSRMRPPPQLHLMRQIKAVFDPGNILNPGKIL